MYKRLNQLLALILAFVLLLPVTYVGKAEAQGKITMAWTWTEGGLTDTYTKQINNSKNLDIVSPTGIYLVDANGTLQNQIDNNLVNYAHQQGKKVWALFANQGFSKDKAHGVLIDTDKRKKVIQEVTDMAVSNNYDGINLDWEGLYTEDRDLFTEFVRELTASLRARNKTVSVDVTVLTPTWDMSPFSNWTYCYDRKTLGQIVDYVVLMAYDEHNKLRPNGSVASLLWVEDGIKYLLNDVPAEKVILGVPFYTHDFSDEYKNGSEYIGLDETQRRISQNNVSVTWDLSVGQNVATYYRSGYKHTIWVEDDRSLGLKLDLVNKYNIAGMAAWSLGSEASSTWDVISSKMGKVQVPPSVPQPPSSGTGYIVQPGDTLWRIAQKYGVTVDAVIKANNLDPNKYIMVGQRLVIPGTVTLPGTGSGGNSVYFVQAGDTLWRIAQKYNTTVDGISKANNIDPNKYLYVGQKLTIPGSGAVVPAQPVYYTVLAGDTLWKIAQRYGTTVTKLAQLNIIDPNKPIYIGQKLRVQ